MKSLWKILTLFALLAYGLCMIYSMFINAEVRFWTQAAKKKSCWSESMSTSNKVIFAGGSTTLFAFQSQRLYEETGVQTVNMGMTVGMGIPYLCALAFNSAKQGDILILALEPSLLKTGSLKPTALSVQTALRTGQLRTAFGASLWDTPTDWGLVLGSMRPGAYHVVTALLKAVFKRPAYRYPENNVDASGCLSMNGTDPETIPFGKMDDLTLPERGRELLQFLADEGHKRGVTVYYALPWLLCEESHLENNRKVHRKLMQDIAEILPVLEDEFSGCSADPSLFFDQVHLTPTGAKLRSDQVIQAIQQKNFVTRSDPNRTAP